MPRFSGWSSPVPVDQDFIVHLQENTPAEQRHNLQLSERTGLFNAASEPQRIEHVVVAVQGRLQWQDSSIKQIASESGAERALLEAWRRDGANLFRYLQGPCCFAIVDLQNDEMILATDKLGIHNLYYAEPASGGVVFGDTIDAVCRFPGIERHLSSQALYNFVYFHMIPGPGSIYQQVKKLAPAHYLHCKAGAVQLQRYWSPEFSENTALSMDAMGAELKDLMRDIVADRVREAGGRKVGSFLSGGLDSSTITGFLSQATTGQANSYTIGFDAEGYDEVEYARIAAKEFKTKGIEYYLTPEDIIDAVPRIAAHYDEPFGNSSVIPTYYCAKLAAENGTDILLAGDGGDELFAGNERYAKQQVFELYNHLPSFAQQGLNGLLSSDGMVDKASVLRKAKSYVEQATIPLPDRLQTYNFLHQHPPQEIFTDQFLCEVDFQLPLNLLRETYQQPDQATALNRMLNMDWHYTLAWNDLRKVSRVCELAGIDVEYPMLDEQLIEFSTRIPSAWKLNKLRLRYFYKQSMSGFLPEAILKKPKHGFGLPFGVWAKTHPGLKELIHDNISALKARGFINPAFIDRALDMHDNSHADYYGELLWVLMMLELWLCAHID